MADSVLRSHERGPRFHKLAPLGEKSETARSAWVPTPSQTSDKTAWGVST